jgi:hypothetical protein
VKSPETLVSSKLTLHLSRQEEFEVGAAGAAQELAKMEQQMDRLLERLNSMGVTRFLFLYALSSLPYPFQS